MRSDVVALYVDPRDPYPKLVEQWYDEKRDARTYEGPWPVVAHPPCGRWGRMAHLTPPGRIPRHQDKPLGPIAVGQVRAFGGVLEHPEASKLFEHCGMPRPGELPDRWGGFTIAVDQCDWGHVARKRTWLYLVGTSCKRFFWPMPGKPTRIVSTSRKDDCSLLRCSQQARRRTPFAFAEWLLELAATARPRENVCSAQAMVR